MGLDDPGMGREGGVLELGSCLIVGRYMELAASGNHSFSHSSSSLPSFTEKAERSVDSDTKVLPRSGQAFRFHPDSRLLPQTIPG